MSSLIELIDNSITDKNTTHSYLELYESLLISKKEKAKNVLEIGVDNGGSIKLWYDYFQNASIYGIDIKFKDSIAIFQNKERICLSCFDAYEEEIYKTRFIKNIKFDMILDDGPHTLESQVQCIKLYSQLLTEDGIFIIEDVQDMSWLEVLYNTVPEHLKQFVKMYDLRGNKGRYDDIVFTINKSLINLEV